MTDIPKFEEYRSFLNKRLLFQNCRDNSAQYSEIIYISYRPFIESPDVAKRDHALYHAVVSHQILNRAADIVLGKPSERSVLPALKLVDIIDSKYPVS